MNKGIHFIHTADLHLDSPFLGLKDVPTDLFSQIQNSTFQAFETLINEAINREVDFMLIVGDLFDGEDRSIKAQARLRNQMEKLKKAGIHVFISYGNHDHLSGTWLNLEMPDNVHIFSSQVSCIPFTTRAGLNVQLYGFSYPTRHITDRKVLEFNRSGEADFHIGLLHGHCEESKSDHQPYAPFTISELLTKQMDYWALGHIHKSQILHKDPYIVYPGNPQGRHKNEPGEKIGYDVFIDIDGQTTLQKIPTARIRWESLVISCDPGMTFTDLYKQCITGMKNILDDTRCGVLLKITLKATNQVSTDIKQKIENNEFLEMIQEGTEMNPFFIWPYTIIMEEENEEETLFEDPLFWNLMDQTILEYHPEEIEDALSSLYSHVYASRYLVPLQDETKDQLLIEGQKLLSARLRAQKAGVNR